MSYESRLRKVGGSVMLAIPSAALNEAGLAVDDAVELKVKSGRLVVEPSVRRRYSLDELIAQCKSARRLPKDRVWVAGKRAGRELI